MVEEEPPHVIIFDDGSVDWKGVISQENRFIPEADVTSAQTKLRALAERDPLEDGRFLFPVTITG